MILPKATSLSINVWEQSARRSAGQSQATFEVYRPSASVLIEQGGQADLIRQVVRAGALALIVVPENPEELGPALLEARKQGVPAISILEPIRVDDDEPIPVLARSPASEYADQLVEAALEDALIVGYTSEDPVLLLSNVLGVDAEERTEALVNAVEAAGLSLFGGEPTRFRNNPETAFKRIQDAKEQAPRLAIVLVTEDVGFQQAISLREQIEPSDRYVMAGYIGDRRNMNMVRTSFASAAAEYSDIEIGAMAAKTALQLHRGEELPAEILIKPRVQRAPNPPSRGNLD